MYTGRKFEFETQPASPLKIQGEAWSVGWDIPTLWAIDADNQCWCNDAHGSALVKVPLERLLSEAGDEPHTQVLIRKTLGMKPKLPSWVSEARQAGWTPPADWNESKYE